MDRIREATMGDQEFLAELIELFLDDTPKQIEALRKAVLGRDPEQAAQMAHRLKGSTGNIGADGLSEICQRAEGLGKTEDFERLKPVIEELDREYARVADCLATMRTATGAGPPAGGSES